MKNFDKKRLLAVIKVPDIETRLQERYEKVQQHLSIAKGLTPDYDIFRSTKPNGGGTSSPATRRRVSLVEVDKPILEQAKVAAKSVVNGRW
ncbi:MAG: hypothetical protein IPM55_17205 [Acidobacteria bacterium]|nr:hypothetical protein [Acidobacteriota bacterium]